MVNKQNVENVCVYKKGLNVAGRETHINLTKMLIEYLSKQNLRGWWRNPR